MLVKVVTVAVDVLMTTPVVLSLTELSTRDSLKKIDDFHDHNTLKAANSTPRQGCTLSAIVAKNDRAFSTQDRLFSKAKLTPVIIRLKDDEKPTFIDHAGPLFNSDDKAIVVCNQVKDWLRDGVIVPSNSEYTTYSLIANNTKKKRVCPAFLKLNAVTVFEPYPIPTLDAVR